MARTIARSGVPVDVWLSAVREELGRFEQLDHNRTRWPDHKEER